MAQRGVSFLLNRIKQRRMHLPRAAPERMGNQVKLLCMGAQYFPSVLQDIDKATQQIHLETYIFAQDQVGEAFAQALARAAQRGVDVSILIDGFGSKAALEHWEPFFKLTDIKLRVFRPERSLWHVNRQRLRRMHRKVVVIDQTIAYVGGINVHDDFNHVEQNSSALNVTESGRFDFAVRLQGPAVLDVWRATQWLWWQTGFKGDVVDGPQAHWWQKRMKRFWQMQQSSAWNREIEMQGDTKVRLVLRDNLRFRRHIERAYLAAIRNAQTEIVLANAYFLPGRRFRRALKQARVRGVRVRLLLQGKVEYWLQHYATQGLYDSLLLSGVEIYEYQPGFLHAKVGVIDNEWVTIGSSNLDPLSLFFAREANLVMNDRALAESLSTQLEQAMELRSLRIEASEYAKRPWTSRVVSWVCYRVLRATLSLVGLKIGI